MTIKRNATTKVVEVTREMTIRPGGQDVSDHSNEHKLQVIVRFNGTSGGADYVYQLAASPRIIVWQNKNRKIGGNTGHKTVAEFNAAMNKLNGTLIIEVDANSLGSKSKYISIETALILVAEEKASKEDARAMLKKSDKGGFDAAIKYGASLANK